MAACVQYEVFRNYSCKVKDWKQTRNEWLHVLVF